MAKIFLDPGHGGTDPGAVGNGLKEKEITLHLAKRIEKFLNENYTGLMIRFSRTKDRALSLNERCDMANSWGADIFVSIHVNAGAGTGFESFIFNGNVSSKTIAYQNIIHEQIMENVVGNQDRGKKRANFVVLRATNMPAILTENLFIDTKADAALLKNVSFLDSLAKGHADGIAKALGLTKKTIAPKVEVGKGVYRVITGSFTKKVNAESRVKELKKAGFESFIEGG